MLNYVHGGDIQTYIDRHGFAPLDLSANINPFGIPDAVRAAMHRAVDNCTQYPDPFCRAARQAIGAREGVNPDFLYCGNGAADVLDRLAAVLKPRKVLLTAPTFAEYERTLSGAEIRVHNLRETDGFALTERILDEISPDLDAVYLCNPNNPTGRTAQPELLREIVRKCTENGVKLVVDECFNDFLTDAERHTRKDLLESNPGLIILRAYTKMYAVPGVRFGWCMTADAVLIEKLYHAGQPWNVSVIAQACAAAAAPEPNRFLKSFLFYVPYVTLAVMTFPAIVQATQSPIAGIAALVIGIVISYLGAGLFPVACICCAVVFIFELFLV